MEKTRIGIVGTGFIGTGFALEASRQKDVTLSKVLTRRKLDTMTDYPFQDVLTNSVQELLEHSDIIVETSGDVLYGTEVIHQAMQVRIPVVTMNAELQVTTGSFFARNGFITEAEGDQPGCLAALHENVVKMGFRPLVYGNIKGFLNENPNINDMQYWSKKNGIRIDMTTSFTDGTKVQIEQALVANGLGLTIAKDGLLQPKSDDIEKTGALLAERAKQLNEPIADFVVSAKGPPGVFITAEHEPDQQTALRYFKMGDSPYYTIVQNFHLCHLEIMKTVQRVRDGQGVLLNNSKQPKISVAAIAKRTLKPGERINKGIGSFQVRGEAVRIADNKNHVPIGLLVDCIVKRKVEVGEMLTFADVELPESFALYAWQETMREDTFNMIR